MNPALSIIVFTVASGTGLGLLALTVILAVFGVSGGLAAQELLIGGAVGLGLTTVGLVSSTFHLASPKNAWRAFSRFRSSWLSREAVFAVLFYPFALFYFGAVWWHPDGVGWAVNLAGLSAVLLALTTVFATGMIYACLRTIRQWNTALVPANYVLMGLALGALVLTLILVRSGGNSGLLAGISIILLATGWLGKALYYLWIGKPQGPTINTATGFTRASVKLLDVGHSSGTFHTQEFGYQAPVALVSGLRWAVYLLGFGFPVMLSAWVLSNNSIAAAGLAVLSGLIGAAIERWLFFVEARHSVNLFHGHQRC